MHLARENHADLFTHLSSIGFDRIGSDIFKLCGLNAKWEIYMFLWCF
jgi:hypothetical protein